MTKWSASGEEIMNVQAGIRCCSCAGTQVKEMFCSLFCGFGPRVDRGLWRDVALVR